jgi:hypothetical protein
LKETKVTEKFPKWEKQAKAVDHGLRRIRRRISLHFGRRGDLRTGLRQKGMVLYRSFPSAKALGFLLSSR